VTILRRPAGARVRRVAVERPRLDDATPEPRAFDAVAVEEPLEIRLDGRPIAVTMRTPGDDEELVRGFLLTEGIVLRPDEVRAVELGEDGRADALLADGVEVDAEQFRRNLFVSSSCGICGKASIEAVDLLAPPARPFTVTRTVVAALTAGLGAHQPVFDETGGLHAAGIFDLEGNALAAREDVGRHNAVDKTIGAIGLAGWPPPPALLVVSGRQSFEIVQKAAMARLGGVVGVSAPSSLAVELAESLGLLLVGFARGERFNVYAGADHLDG
jgi:FdhD protein